MAADTPLTAAERAALLVKHAASLEKFDAECEKSIGITKIPCAYSAATLATMLRDGRIIRWDQNRKEVKARAGTSEMFMVTLAAKRSVGTFVCYWNGKPIADADGRPQIRPSKDHPIVIYEGGHRSRWLDQIFNNKTEVCTGLDLKTLEQLRPEAAKKIRTARFTLDVNTHESGVVPEDYIKEEYEIINTTVTAFSIGESVASSTDDVRNNLQTLLKAALSHRKPSTKARDGELAEIRALVNGALGQFMDLKKESLHGQPPPTAEQILNAEENIAAFAEAENQVIALFDNNAPLKTRIDARKSDFKMDSALMAGLAACVSAAQREAVIDDYVSLYFGFFENKEEWKATLKEITGGGAGKHNSGNSVFVARWKKVVNLVRPPDDLEEGEALNVADAV